MKNDIRPNYYSSCGEIGRRVLDGFIPADWLDEECIETINRMNASFHLGNALKYLWRAGMKTEIATEDLVKARFYLSQYKQQGYLVYSDEVAECLRKIEVELKKING